MMAPFDRACTFTLETAMPRPAPYGTGKAGGWN